MSEKNMSHTGYFVEVVWFPMSSQATPRSSRSILFQLRCRSPSSAYSARIRASCIAHKSIETLLERSTPYSLPTMRFVWSISSAALRMCDLKVFCLTSRDRDGDLSTGRRLWNLNSFWSEFRIRRMKRRLIDFSQSKCTKAMYVSATLAGRRGATSRYSTVDKDCISYMKDCRTKCRRWCLEWMFIEGRIHSESSCVLCRYKYDIGCAALDIRCYSGSIHAKLISNPRAVTAVL